MQYLEGKVAVITGAARSIGLASVDAFKREGATVVAVEIKGESPAADLFLTADLTVEREVAALYGTVAEQYGRIDVLFNNAGIALPEDGSILTTELAVVNRLLEVSTVSVASMGSARRPRRSPRPLCSWPAAVAVRLVIGSVIGPLTDARSHTP